MNKKRRWKMKNIVKYERKHLPGPSPLIEVSLHKKWRNP